MKKTIRIFGTILLAALYLWATSFVFAPVEQVEKQDTSATGSQVYFSVSTLSFYNQQIQPEKIAANANSFPAPAFKKNVQSVYGTLKASGQIFQNSFIQYIRLSVTFPIEYRKADQLFPFHYFW
ncbi:MAG: hypothetical protein R2757_19630 [Draconibacterium sp.]|mgnify:CR=1 FL=1|jgi:hypothetical protein